MPKQNTGPKMDSPEAHESNNSTHSDVSDARKNTLDTLRGARESLAEFADLLKNGDVQGFNELLRNTEEPIKLKGLNISDVNLDGLNLSGLTLENSTFTNCNLNRLQAKGSLFLKLTLKNTNAEECTFDGSTFISPTFDGSVKDSSFEGCVFASKKINSMFNREHPLSRANFSNTLFFGDSPNGYGTPEPQEHPLASGSDWFIYDRADLSRDEIDSLTSGMRSSNSDSLIQLLGEYLDLIDSADTDMTLSTHEEPLYRSDTPNLEKLTDDMGVTPDTLFAKLHYLQHNKFHWQQSSINYDHGSDYGDDYLDGSLEQDVEVALMGRKVGALKKG